MQIFAMKSVLLLLYGDAWAPFDCVSISLRLAPLIWEMWISPFSANALRSENYAGSD